MTGWGGVFGRKSVRLRFNVSVVVLATLVGSAVLAPAAGAVAAKDTQITPGVPPDYSKLPPLPAPKQVDAGPSAPEMPKGIEGPEPGASSKPADVAGAPVELTDRRTATSKVFRLPNGDLRAQIHQHPINFKTAKGDWDEIDSHIVPGDKPGTFRNKANAWRVSFGDTTAGVELKSEKSALTYAPLDAAIVEPVVGDDGVSVVYKNAWPNADLVYRVTSDRVEEDIVLTAPTSQSSFAFKVRGNLASKNPSSPDRDTKPGASFHTAEPMVRSKHGAAVPEARPKADSGATDGNGDSIQTTSVDADWLAQQPASAYPITIDPPATDDWFQAVAFLGDRVTHYDNSIIVGKDSGGNVYRSVVAFDYGDQLGARVHNAALNVHLSSGYFVNAPFTVWAANAWNFDGIAPQPALISDYFAASDYSFNSAAFVSQLDNWVHSGVLGGALLLQGDEAGANTFKDLDVSLTLDYNFPPDWADPVAPADGATVSTFNPTFAVSPANDYPDYPQPVTYRFQIFTSSDGTGTPVIDTVNYISDRSLTTGGGVLHDGVTYTWRVTTYDGTDTTLGPLRSFRVNRRLADDPTQGTDAMGPFKVNLGNGNVTTSVGTIPVATVAGSLQATLSYTSTPPFPYTALNGLPVRWSLAVGDSALAYLSAKVEAAGVVLTGVDGVTHTYALKPGGGYTPPAGENGVLAANSTDGSYTLQEEDGRTYVFDSFGRISSVRSSVDDRKPAALQYVYTGSGSGAKLTSVTDPARGGAAVMVLNYQGTGSCPSVGSFDAYTTGQLCNITSPTDSNHATNVFYKSGLVSRVVNVAPVGGDAVYDFGYDTSGHMTMMRDPMLSEWVAGHLSDDANVRWEVAYDSVVTSPTWGWALSATGPRPDPAIASRPRHAFTYRLGQDTAGFYAYTSSLTNGIDVAVGDVDNRP